jgi:hypothetical protein
MPADYKMFMFENERTVILNIVVYSSGKGRIPRNGHPDRHRINDMKRLCAAALTVWLLPGESFLAGDLADFTTPLFSGAGNCALCHDPRTPDSTTGGAILATDWRGTMMAHSFKDPLWRAVMEYEVRTNPGLKSFIEDKCQSCHAALARTQARSDGTNRLTFADARLSTLAGEGVGCTLCHQIQETNLGT